MCESEVERDGGKQTARKSCEADLFGELHLIFIIRRFLPPLLWASAVIVILSDLFFYLCLGSKLIRAYCLKLSLSTDEEIFMSICWFTTIAKLFVGKPFISLIQCCLTTGSKNVGLNPRALKLSAYFNEILTCPSTSAGKIAGNSYYLAEAALSYASVVVHSTLNDERLLSIIRRDCFHCEQA